MAKKRSKGSGTTSVMLRPGRAAFRRSRRNSKGEIIETQVFEPLQVFEVTNDWVDALFDDIGNALVIAKVGQDGKPRVDWDSTTEVVQDRDGDEPEQPEVQEAVTTPSKGGVNEVEPTAKK